MQSWGELRVMLDTYKSEMERIEKMHARRAAYGLAARPPGTRWLTRLSMAKAWIMRLALRPKAAGKLQEPPMTPAPSDLLRQE